MGSRRWVRLTATYLLLKILLSVAIGSHLPCEAGLSDRIRGFLLQKNAGHIRSFFENELFGRHGTPITTDEVANVMTKSRIFGNVTFGNLRRTLEGLEKCATEFPDDILVAEKNPSWNRFYFVDNWFSVNVKGKDVQPYDVINSLALTIIHLWQMPCRNLQQKNALSFKLPKKQLRNFALLTLMVQRAQNRWMSENVEATRQYSGKELLYIAMLHFFATQSPSQFEKMNSALRKKNGETDFMRHYEMVYFSDPYHTNDWNQLWKAKTSSDCKDKCNNDVPQLDWTIAIPEKYDAVKRLFARIQKMVSDIGKEKAKRISTFLPCFHNSDGFYDVVTTESIPGKYVYVYKYMRHKAQEQRYFSEADTKGMVRNRLANVKEDARKTFASLAPMNCTSKKNIASLGADEDFYVIKKSAMRKRFVFSGGDLIGSIIGTTGVVAIIVFMALGMAELPLFVLLASTMGVIIGGVALSVLVGVVLIIERVVSYVMSVAVKEELSQVLTRVAVLPNSSTTRGGSNTNLPSDNNNNNTNVPLVEPPTTTAVQEKVPLIELAVQSQSHNRQAPTYPFVQEPPPYPSESSPPPYSPAHTLYPAMQVPSAPPLSTNA